MSSARRASTPEGRAALVVAALGTMLSLVAFTAPLATITATGASLGADVAGRTWVLSSMSIGLGAALLTAGTLADDLGRRRVLVIGLVVLAVASAVGTAATSVLLFTLARVVQGVGAAAVIAASLGLIAWAFPPGPARASASGVWGASVGAGIAVGPILASVLDRYASWRVAYALLAVASLAVAVGAQRSVAESRNPTRRGLDLPGAALLATGVSALLAGLVVGRQGWTRPAVPVLLGLAAVLLVLFVVVERRSRAAMLDLFLFREPRFVAATTAAFASGAGVIALFSYLSGFEGTALGIPATTAAWLLVAWSATSVVTALLARYLPGRFSGRTQLGIGLLGVAVGQLTMAGTTPSSGWTHFVPGLLLAGVFSGMVNAALGREAVASVPEGQGALGSGANNTARYVGSAVGVTVVAVVASVGQDQGSAGLVEGWNHAVAVTVVVSVVGGLVALLSRSRSSSSAAIDGPPGGPRRAGRPR